MFINVGQTTHCLGVHESPLLRRGTRKPFSALIMTIPIVYYAVYWWSSLYRLLKSYGMWIFLKLFIVHIMSNFIKLRLILQEQRPAFHNFIAELGQQQLQNGDLDLLLRKAVEGRIPDFPNFCRALVRYIRYHLAKERTSIFMTRKVEFVLSRPYQQSHDCLREG